jgi:predicted ATPase
MLTRLKVNGFKNLVDVDVRFGPFTCIAGVNGSGKSNLFDAIRFLSALAEKPLVEAALSVRGVESTADIRSLFHRVGDTYADEMSFEAEMIIPSEGVDDLGRPIQADTTLVRYGLRLVYDDSNPAYPGLPLRIVSERLDSIQDQSHQDVLAFPFDDAWIESAARRSRDHQGSIFASMEGPGGRLRWTYEGDGHTPDDGGLLIGAPVFRSFLSSPSESRSQTTILARQEMRSWQVLDLHPAAIRRSNYVTDPRGVADDGAGAVATLYGIANIPPSDGRDPYEAQTAVYARVANRIRQLIGDVWEIAVEPVNARGELELTVKGREGTTHSVRALSDGTLRFFALAVIEEEQKPGLLCLEEPENGIHPGRIESLLELLQAIAMDTRYPIEEGNPLRQVIISTHSPSVVMRVPGDSLVVAELRDTVRDGKHFNRAHFSGLANTWRDPVPGRKSLPVGALRTYVSPEGYRPLPRPDPERDPDAEPRIMDRDDVRRMLSPTAPA